MPLERPAGAMLPPDSLLPHALVLTCCIPCQARVDEAIAGGKTPLIVDPSEDGKVRAFYEYKGSVLDLQELFKGPVLDGLPAKDAMDVARAALVTAIKEGNTLVLYLGSLVPKLRDPKKFTSPNKFPLDLFKVGHFDIPRSRTKIFRFVAAGSLRCCGCWCHGHGAGGAKCPLPYRLASTAGTMTKSVGNARRRTAFVSS